LILKADVRNKTASHKRTLVALLRLKDQVRLINQQIGYLALLSHSLFVLIPD